LVIPLVISNPILIYDVPLKNRTVQLKEFTEQMKTAWSETGYIVVIHGKYYETITVIVRVVFY